MELIQINSSRTQEIKRLNGNFKDDTLKLKVTIDTTKSKSYYINTFPTLLFKILELFPNIKQHNCFQGEAEFASRNMPLMNIGLPIKLVGDVIDTVHLLEHVILEIQCQVDNMDECSGLTCNYWEPENRYDVFIECNHIEVATFSTKIALQLFNSILYDEAHVVGVNDIVKMASHLRDQKHYSIDKIAQKFRWSKTKIEKNIMLLQELSYPFLQPHLVA